MGCGRTACKTEFQDDAYLRCLFKANGYSDEELVDRPMIGIANSWTSLVPGHYNLRSVAAAVEKGIYRGGGTAVEFGVIAACDGIANGHEGMKYILPSREIITSSIEIEAKAHKLDGLVLLGSCDKILPAMLNAAVRLNIPAIIVNGGPMQGGIVFDGKKADATAVDEALAMLRAGKLEESVFENLENTVCPGCGSCSFFGSANTMGCLTETLGMCLPGTSLIPAVYADRERAAYMSGIRICEMVKENLRPRDIITEEAIHNAIRVTMAISGSTNAAIHLAALAYEADIDMNVADKFDEYSKDTPQLVKINPASVYNTEEFHLAGGMPKVMRNLGKLINLGCMTCTGRSIAENLHAYKHPYPENDTIIRSVENAYAMEGGVAILRGNLAPETGITKPGAYPANLHVLKGKARVFDNEEAANDAILSGTIDPGTIIVIRYEGPKGGPGMREMYKSMKYLYGQGLNTSCAVVTDGRFSGTNNGCFVGHISPEAAEGGPIAVVEDGDVIEINVPEGRISVELSDEEIQERLKNWKPAEKTIPKGYLRTYAKLASSAATGAVFK